MSDSAELCLLKIFLPYAIKEWNKLDPELEMLKHMLAFEKCF